MKTMLGELFTVFIWSSDLGLANSASGLCFWCGLRASCIPASFDLRSWRPLRWNSCFRFLMMGNVSYQSNTAKGHLNSPDPEVCFLLPTQAGCCLACSATSRSKFKNPPARMCQALSDQLGFAMHARTVSRFGMSQKDISRWEQKANPLSFLAGPLGGGRCAEMAYFLWPDRNEPALTWQYLYMTAAVRSASSTRFANC